MKKNLRKLFIISRFLVGTNFIILILAGWMRTKLRDYLRAYFPGMVMWFLGMTTVAYVLISGFHYLSSEKIFKQIELLVAGALILIFVGEHFLKKVLQKAAFAEERAEEIGKFVEEEIDRSAKDGSAPSWWANEKK